MPKRTVQEDGIGLYVNAFGWIIRPTVPGPLPGTHTTPAETLFRKGQVVILSSADDPMSERFGCMTGTTADKTNHAERWYIRGSETAEKRRVQEMTDTNSALAEWVARQHQDREPVWVIEVSEVHAHLVHADNREQAERIALATSRGHNKTVVKATDVTDDYYGDDE